MSKATGSGTQTGALGVPKELAGFLELFRGVVRGIVREELKSAEHATDRRIRHDRIALPKRAVLADIRAGKLAAQKIGKFYFVQPEELERYYAARAQEKPAPEGDEFEAAMQRAGLRKGASR
ncbi:hypothetical protein WMF18_29490 [Sorangium sp. So ce315]|uniref:hypothetical protein n=1 Tax=Sorangium sp. So ce315 TaxID=3133299 RepID=UPI003F5F5C17